MADNPEGKPGSESVKGFKPLVEKGSEAEKQLENTPTPHGMWPGSERAQELEEEAKKRAEGAVPDLTTGEKAPGVVAGFKPLIGEKSGTSQQQENFPWTDLTPEPPSPTPQPPTPPTNKG